MIFFLISQIADYVGDWLTKGLKKGPQIADYIGDLLKMVERSHKIADYAGDWLKTGLNKGLSNRRLRRGLAHKQVATITIAGGLRARKPQGGSIV